MFAALAEGYGDLQKKINLFVALCPITNLGHSSNSFMVGASSSIGYDSLAGTLWSFSIHELIGPKWKYISGAFCLAFPCKGL